MATFLTRDGHIMDDRAISSLIGSSLPTEEACRAAVALLHTALAHPVSLAELWELSRIAVWGGGLEAARSALRAIQAGQTLTTPAVAPAASAASLAWSEQITWDDDEAPPAPAAPAGDELVADFDHALAQLSLL